MYNFVLVEIRVKLEIELKRKINNFFLSRPDNWVHYDAMQKVPLPQLPSFKSEYDENSSEMPRPMSYRQNARGA